MMLESLLDDTTIGGAGRIQIDRFGQKWRCVIARFNGPQVMREDVTPSAALRSALIEDERLSRDMKPAAVDPRQVDLEDFLAGEDLIG